MRPQKQQKVLKTLTSAVICARKAQIQHKSKDDKEKQFAKVKKLHSEKKLHKMWQRMATSVLE